MPAYGTVFIPTWKAIVKQIIAYFEGVADIHNNTAKALTTLGAMIQVPFRAASLHLSHNNSPPWLQTGAM
jgi:hypothetical protein